MSLVYFGAVATNYGTAFWLPQIIKGFGLSNTGVGFVTAIPYLIGAIGMVLWSRSSDARMERKGHAAVAFLLAAVGIAGSTVVDDPVMKMIALSVGAVGVFAVLPVFWTLPTAFLSGASAAAGIAVINSIGNLAGFAGPFAMGWLKDLTGRFLGRAAGDCRLRRDGAGDRPGAGSRYVAGEGAGNAAGGVGSVRPYPSRTTCSARVLSTISSNGISRFSAPPERMEAARRATPSGRVMGSGP